MLRNASWGLILVGALAFFGCGRESALESGHRDRRVAGTTVPLEARDQSIVAIVAYHPSSRGPLSYCTGALIAPNKVLTAAHCAPDIGGFPAGTYYWVYSGNSFLGNPSPASFVPVVEWLHDDYGIGPQLPPYPFESSRDVAVAVLRTPLSAPPLPIAYGTITHTGIPIRIVGYGVNLYEAVVEMGESWSQSKARVIAKSGGGVKRAGFGTVTEVYRSRNGSAVEGFLTRGSARGCKGDSGGPAIVALGGQWHIVGVVSTGFPDGEGANAKITCSNSALTSVDHAKAFLDQVLARP